MTFTDAAEKLLSARHATRLRPFAERLRRIVFAVDDLAVAQRMALTAFVIRVVSAAIAFVSQIILARVMGDFEYGIFVFVWVMAVILGNLSCLGFHTAVIRFLPQYRAEGNEDAIRGLATTARIFAMLSATVIGAAGMIAIHLLGDRVQEFYVIPLFMGAFALPMIALGDVLDGTARANGWPVHALAPTYIVRPILILVFVVAAAYLLGQTDARLALMASLLACWLTTLAQFIVMTRKLAQRYRPGRISVHFRTWSTVAFPIFLIEGFYFLLTNADVVIVGIYLPPEKVAVYYAAAKTMALVHFVYFAVKTGAAPRFSGLVSSGSREEMASFAGQTVHWAFWPSLIVGLLVILAGPFLLSLFGPGFEAGHEVMMILFLGIIAKAMVGPAEVLLTMAGEQKVTVGVYGAALAVNIVLNVTLIPVLGIAGAATATAVAMMAEAVLLHITVRRRLGIVLFIGAGSGRRSAE
jgi:Membrane protein involved in the export of O-antigen and teichoic acid